MAKGTGTLDVAVELLPIITALLPKTYEIVGSLESTVVGVVRIKVSSDLIVGDSNLLECVVRDAGSTRRVMVLPK